MSDDQEQQAAASVDLTVLDELDFEEGALEAQLSAELDAELLRKEHPELFEQTNSGADQQTQTDKLRQIIADNKKKAANAKKNEDDVLMQRYIAEEKAAQEAAVAMKERIENRKKRARECEKRRYR